MIVNSGKAYFRGRIEAASAVFGATLYMALSTDATAPSATDTGITGEQTSNGLARVAVTASHTTGTNTWSYTNTFTYTGGATVNVQKVALFDAASGGNLITEDVITAAQFAANGDNAPFTVTISL